MSMSLIHRNHHRIQMNHKSLNRKMMERMSHQTRHHQMSMNQMRNRMKELSMSVKVYSSFLTLTISLSFHANHHYLILFQYAPVSKDDIEPSPKLSIGPIDAELEMDFSQLFSQQFWKKVDSDSPQPFEYLGSRNGLILYSTTIDFKSTSPSMLTINALRDRAYVYIDKVN
uniref:Beta-galactosidase 1-like first all-beta domain-containing protein n=1 Tax=Tetranychus urticae TaxID=32264 RepID=T1KKR2_TETUR